MNRTFSLFLSGTLIAGFLSSSAWAATAPKTLGKFGYWEAFQLGDGANAACYMTLRAKPPVPKGSKLKRGEVTLMITQRPAEGSLDVISYAAGTKFKPASEVTVQAGTKAYSLFTQADTAWARDSLTDRDIAMAIRNTASITISGEAASGGPFADTIAMKGATEAYRAIGKACGLPSPTEAPRTGKAPKKK